METKTPQAQLELQVKEAVKDVLALRSLGKKSHMETTKAQTAILRGLPLDVLGRVARILEEMDSPSEGGAK